MGSSVLGRYVRLATHGTKTKFNVHIERSLVFRFFPDYPSKPELCNGFVGGRRRRNQSVFPGSSASTAVLCAHLQLCGAQSSGKP